MSLPNTGMSFTPFDPLPASDLNDLVENIEFLNTLIDSSSSHTIIGANDVRATRFVISSPSVQLVDVDPSATTSNSVDITANTSARAFAALLEVGISSSTTAGRQVYLRKTGSGAANDNLTIAGTNQGTTGIKVWSLATVELDSSQSFDWLVSNADVNALTIVLKGYYEYVD